MNKNIIEQLESRTLFSVDTISSFPPINTSNQQVIYLNPAVSTTSTKVGATWVNTSIGNQKTLFTVDFDAVASKNKCDTVLGVSGLKAKTYSQMAAIVRFNNTNTIDVRNGGIYASDQQINYTAGQSYHIKFIIDPTQQVYSVYVTPSGGSQISLATNYAFRSEQSSVSVLTNFSGYSSTGNVVVSNLSINAVSVPPSVPTGFSATAVSASQLNLSWNNSSGSTGSTILKSTDGVNFSVLSNVSSGVNSFSDTGLVANTTYYYEVYNSNSVGNSPVTNIVSATTLTNNPTNGKPDATNTGPLTTNLQSMGGITITTAGTVLDGVSITGTVVIKAANVTIENFKLNANGSVYGVQVVSGSVTLQDGEITNAMGAAVIGNNWTALRLNVHEMGSDAFDGGGHNDLENCYIHNIGMSAGSHADGIQLNNGDTIVIKNNNIDTPYWSQIGSQVYRCNSCIFLNGYVYNYLDGTVIDHNWLNGGNYSIYALGQTNTKVTNNVFGEDYQYGLIDGSVSDWADNVDINGTIV